MLWIYFTLLAAFMQAVRTAGQKQLSGKLSAMSTTAVRYLFALPFAWLYLAWLVDFNFNDLPKLSENFLTYASVAAISQILGTMFLVLAFRYRNFSVATSLAKTEALQVAIIGAWLFAEPLTVFGWLSVFVGSLGVWLLAKTRFSLKEVMENPGSLWGLASGLGLAVTTLLIRESSQSLAGNPMICAAVTLVFMITLQSILSIMYLLIYQFDQIQQILTQWRLASFVGITSLLGSIGWFTAVTFQTAAYVKALGQIEFFITLMLTYRVFKETITVREYFGMAFIIASVFLLLFWA